MSIESEIFARIPRSEIRTINGKRCISRAGLLILCEAIKELDPSKAFKADQLLAAVGKQCRDYEAAKRN